MARGFLQRHLPFSESTTTLQAVSYLLGISLFSISFLVFLNSSISFVITDLIGVKHGVGDIVGTLGFVDELVALVACPLWGLVSDRLGVRFVAMVGYAVIGVSLFLFVQTANVYPQLLLARILFAVGATATATMVTATLPCLTDDSEPSGNEPPAHHQAVAAHTTRDSVALSVESELTITPERFTRSQANGEPAPAEESHCTVDPAQRKPSILAGYVGLFTGLGALVALLVFLPLPAQFSKIEGVEIGEALQDAYYVVGAVAILVASFVYIGLRKLKGEEGKGFRTLLGLKKRAQQPGGRAFLPYRQLLRDAVALGFTDPQIGLGYLGGFVARASTVAVSAFIPLFVRIFYLDHDQGSDGDGGAAGALSEEELRRRAYVLAAMLTGVAQLFALVAAPVFGHLSSRRGDVNLPVVVATALGVVGYAAFPNLASPEVRSVDGRRGSPAVLLLMALIGLSQIGAIVCSLGSLSRGVLTADLPARKDGAGVDLEVQVPAPVPVPVPAGQGDGAADEGEGEEDEEGREDAPLLGVGAAAGAAGAAGARPRYARVLLKGTIAGVYSWCGGAAILLLTKLGGYLFDAWSRGAPFYMMAVFNALLLVATVAVDLVQLVRRRRELAQ